MAQPKITIRFLRKDDESEKNTDDIIQIHKNTESTFRVTFRTPFVANSVTPILRTLELPSAHDVVQYCMSVLTLLLFDSDPFKSVQIDLPFMPSVLIDERDIGCALPAIEGTLTYQLKGLTHSLVTPTAPPKAKHVFFDDCGRIY